MRPGRSRGRLVRPVQRRHFSREGLEDLLVAFAGGNRCSEFHHLRLARWHPRWSHSPNNCAQPHWHINRCPRLFMRELASVAPSEKHTATASSAACADFSQNERLLRTGSINGLPSEPVHSELSNRHAQACGCRCQAGHESDQRSKDEYDKSGPYPAHKRIQERLDDGLAGVGSLPS